MKIQLHTKAQRLGALQEIRSGELSEEQELELLHALVMDERQRQGIPSHNQEEFDDYNRG